MSDMRCPFCGKQMYHPVGKATWSCQNWDCLKSEGMIGNHVLWQELIRTRKALGIAQDWLEQVATPAKCDDDLCREFTKRKLVEIKTALEQKE